MAAVPRLQARSVAADATQVGVDVDRGDGPNALRKALLPSDALEKGQGLPVGGDSVRRLALHLAPQEVEVDEAGQVLLLFDCRLCRHLRAPGATYVAYVHGRSLALRSQVDMGRIWQILGKTRRIGRLAGQSGPQPPKRPSHRAWAGLVAGLARA